MNDRLCEPSATQVERANMTRFLRSVRKTHGVHLEGYAALYNWSIAQPEQFWSAVWEFCGIKASRRWEISAVTTASHIRQVIVSSVSMASSKVTMPAY